MAENEEVSKEIANIRASIEKIEGMAPEVIEEMHADMVDIFKHVAAAAFFVVSDPVIAQKFTRWIKDEAGSKPDPDPWTEAMHCASMVMHLRQSAEILTDLISSINGKKEE